MNRIVLVIHALVGGGAERVMATIANHWAGEGREVTLLTLDDGSSAPFYALDRRVTHRPLGVAGVSGHLGRSVVNNLVRVRRLRAELRKASPQVVISFMSSVNVLTLLATAGTGIPVIVSERVDPRFHPIGRSWEGLRSIAYRRAARVVVQSNAGMEFFPPAIRKRTVVIANPVTTAPDHAPTDPKHPPESPCRTMVAMGRLEPQKGFDLLIEAFSAIADRHPEWRLEIYGEGSLRKHLNTMIEERALQNRISLCGVTREPTLAFRRADLFVLSSRYEGFPNVLCEAMACGVAVISFDCPSGPREIIRDGIDGLLVQTEDVTALGAAMERLMRDAAERERLGTRAREVTERFSVGRIMDQWLSLANQASDR